MSVFQAGEAVKENKALERSQITQRQEAEARVRAAHFANTAALAEHRRTKAEFAEAQAHLKAVRLSLQITRSHRAVLVRKFNEAYRAWAATSQYAPKAQPAAGKVSG